MNQFKRTGRLYNFDGRINPEASAADLFGAVFEDPDSNGADIRAQVLGTIYDELGLLLDSMSSADDFDVELGQRVLIRTRHWIKLAGALRDRFEAAKNESGEGLNDKDEPAPVKPTEEPPPVVNFNQLVKAVKVALAEDGAKMEAAE